MKKLVKVYNDDKRKVYEGTGIYDYPEQNDLREMLKNADFDYAISNISEAKAYSVLRHISDIEGIWKNKEDKTEWLLV